MESVQQLGGIMRLTALSVHIANTTRRIPRPDAASAFCVTAFIVMVCMMIGAAYYAGGLTR